MVRSRDSQTTGLRREEFVLVGLSAIAFGALVVFVAGRLTPVYLSPDGAHAITDARGLLGLAPRPPYYLPGFPALLIPLDRLGLDPTITIAAGLGFLTGLLFAALYSLARGVASPPAAFFGALVGTGTTPLGELLGWQGGATLLAMVGVTAALAATQRWSRRRRWFDALSVGTCYAVALASHPFVAAFGGVLLMCLWAYHLAHERQFVIHGFGPGSLAGVNLGAIVPVITMLAITNNYLAIDSPAGSSLRAPDLLAPITVFAWMTRESPALSLFTLAIVGAAIATPGHSRVIGAFTAAVFIVLPAVLAGDSSYATRVVYLLAPTLTIGSAALWASVDNRVMTLRQPSQSRVAALVAAAAPLLVGLWVVSLGFPQRLLAAVPYYSSLGRDDYALIQSLTNAPGTVATGWSGNRYWEGMPHAWLVEGITNRPAIGPADPALSTRPVQRQQSAAAWQLFSGAAGVENGALQVSFGPPTWRADPAIAARVGGYYIPFLFIADASNEYGTAAGGGPPISWTMDRDGATGMRLDALTKRVFGTSVQLNGSRVRVTWTREQMSAAESWTIWVWPAYGLPWRDVRAHATSVEFGPYSTQAYRDAAAFDALDPRVRLHVTGGATLQYYANDPRYRIPAIAIHVPASADLELVIDVSGTEQAEASLTYNERDLIARHGVRTALVWRDSGWIDRFSTSPCFVPSSSDERVATFEVSRACVSVLR